MPKRTPRRVSKETHLKVIIVLALLIAVLVWLTHCRATGAAVRPAPKQAASVSSASRVSPPGSVCGISFELPAFDDTTFVLVHPEARYTLCYDTSYRQASWVAYLLTRDEVRSKGAERKNLFRSDPQVVERGWPTARDRDYSRSGYDRGHLLPSADRDDTPQENSATFYLSNVSPQRPALNRQAWRLLEEQVRRWAAQYDSLYVVTGPELKPGLSRIRGGAGIPQRYYKALLVWHDGECRTVAFLLPNATQIPGAFGDYALSVNELESILQLDFFCHLPDSIEERAEEAVDRDFWNWKK